jgi:hypothetical protein
MKAIATTSKEKQHADLKLETVGLLREIIINRGLYMVIIIDLEPCP